MPYFLILILPSLFLLTSAKYTLNHQYNSTNFENEFDTKAYQFGFGYDPNAKMIRTKNDLIYMETDFPKYSSFETFYLTSKKAYSMGLFLFDIYHMPNRSCGIESGLSLVNIDEDMMSRDYFRVINIGRLSKDKSISLSLETPCKIEKTGDYKGQLLENQCGSDSYDRLSCMFNVKKGGVFGKEFNMHGGGVYAVELTQKAIKIWHFSRFSIPPDIFNEKPDPELWDLPLALFHGDCDFKEVFNNFMIIFRFDLCRHFHEDNWSQECTALTGFDSCENFLKKGTLKNSHWLIKSVKIYKDLDPEGFWTTVKLYWLIVILAFVLFIIGVALVLCKRGRKNRRPNLGSVDNLVKEEKLINDLADNGHYEELDGKDSHEELTNNDLSKLGIPSLSRTILPRPSNLEEAILEPSICMTSLIKNSSKKVKLPSSVLVGQLVRIGEKLA